jgi:hypothetical protein
VSGRLEEEAGAKDQRRYERYLASGAEQPWEVWVELNNTPDQDDFDPELLPPQERIRYAEQLIRDGHRVLDDDWLFWGNLADQLNADANIPARSGNTLADWRRFNRAQDMATGIIRMCQRKTAGTEEDS